MPAAAIVDPLRSFLRLRTRFDTRRPDPARAEAGAAGDALAIEFLCLVHHGGARRHLAAS